MHATVTAGSTCAVTALLQAWHDTGRFQGRPSARQASSWPSRLTGPVVAWHALVTLKHPLPASAACCCCTSPRTPKQNASCGCRVQNTADNLWQEQQALDNMGCA